MDHEKVKSWVPIPILIPVNRGAKPGYFPNPGQIGIPRFPGIPANSGWGKIPSILPIPAQSGSGKSRLFSRPNRGGAGRDSGISGSGMGHGPGRYPPEGPGPGAAEAGLFKCQSQTR
jgi:hypothetical protein